MKRYIIIKELIRRIELSGYNLTELSKKCKFQVRNIYYKNKSINEFHLRRLLNILKIRNLKLKEFKIDNTKNLGKYSFSQPIKLTKRKILLAEIIGIMLGDGNLYKNTLNVAFDKRAKDYINYVYNLYKKSFGIELKKKISKKKNAAHLYFYNKYAVEKLINMGLKRGDKIKNKLGIPAWIIKNLNYSKRCLRGLIDTDGSIFLAKRDNVLYIDFTNHNPRLMNDFKDLTKRLGYNFVKCKDTNVCLYRKEEVVRFINDIRPFKGIKWGYNLTWSS